MQNAIGRVSILVVAVLFGQHCQVASGAITTIGFDTFLDSSPIPSGTVITNQFSSVGVLFSGKPGGPLGGPAAWDGSPGSPISPQSISSPNVLVGDAGPFDPIYAAFLQPVSEVSWWWTTVGSSEFTATAFDIDGNVLDSIAVTGPPGNGVGNDVFSTLTASGDLIWRVSFEVTQLNVVDGYAIDDFSFTTAVPEPASLTLCGLGALGCAIAGYRRRKLA